MKPDSKDAEGVSLLPCPFCGSEAKHAFEEGVWHLVRCENRKCGTQSGIFPTKPLALRIWNTRSVPVPHDSEPGCCKGLAPKSECYCWQNGDGQPDPGGKSFISTPPARSGDSRPDAGSDGLTKLIADKLAEPAFANLPPTKYNEVGYLPVIKIGPTAVSWWKVILPSGREINISGDEWKSALASPPPFGAREALGAGDAGSVRPAAFLAWARKMFGPVALVRGERLLRFVEEAIELAHAEGMERAVLDRVSDRVYARPAGETPKEIGQAQACLETFAESIGLSSASEAKREWERVQAIPKSEWERRHNAKQKIGIALSQLPTDEAGREALSEIVRELREDYPAVDVTGVVFSADFSGVGCCVIPQDRVLAIIAAISAIPSAGRGTPSGKPK